MRSALLIMFAIAYAFAAGLGCKREATLPLEVEYAGCAKVLVGPVCGLGEKRELRIWLRVLPSAKIRASAGSETLAVTPEEIADGVGFGVRVPEGAKELALEVTTEAGKGTWRLAVTSTSVPAAIVAAESLWRQGKGTQAEATLVSAMPAMGLAERGATVSALARYALAAGRNDDAIVRLTEAMELHRAAGCISCRVEDGLALVHLLRHTHIFDRARAVLEGIAVDANPYPELHTLWTYFSGSIAYESGDLRSALTSLQRAHDMAMRLGMERTRRAATHVLALTWQALADGATAAKLLAALEASKDVDSDACERAAVLNNMGWIGLLQHESILKGDHSADPQIVHNLESSLQLYEEKCPNAAEAANVRVNLALAAMQQGNPDAARNHLAESDARLPRPEPRLSSWKLDIAGRIALASGRPREAEHVFQDLSKLGENIEAIDAKWRAAQGRAQALIRLGRVETALSAYEQAESLIDEAGRRVPLGDGRDAFLSMHARGTSAYIELLLNQGDVNRAARVARRSRRRAIAAIGRVDRLSTLSSEARAGWESALTQYQRERAELERETASEWRLSGDALRQMQARRIERQQSARHALDEALSILEEGVKDIEIPAPISPGELVLIFHPLQSMWAAFASEASGVTAHRLTTDEVRASPSRWLAPFDSQIRRAERIRIIAAGVADAIDFHALSWKGAPLIAHVPVSYGLDVNQTSTKHPVMTTPAMTIIADPTGNLPAARREAEDVGAVVSGKRWQVSQLVDINAHHEAIQQAMTTSHILHFAGHGQPAHRGLSAALELAHGELTAGDVLAMPRVPPVVVLAGCDTARVSGDGPVVGIGLAHAFIAAGSGAAVAARRRVDDHLTRALMRAFYHRLDSLDGWSVAEALRAAQLERYRADPTSDWAAFRVLLP